MKKWIVQFTHDTMPARMQPQAEKAVHWLVNETLSKHELSFYYESIVVHITPHRLVVMVDVAPIIAGSGKIFLGPRVDAAPQAVNGFMRQHGITDQNKLEQQTNKKGVACYVFYKEQPQRNAIDCLPRVLEDILLNMKWQKSMRWSEGRFMWARPLRQIESVYGTSQLKGGFFLGDDTTPPQYMETPHPNKELFLAFDKLAADDDYDHLAREKREKSITQQVRAIADKHRLTFKKTNVTMMAGLSENPVMLSCPLPKLAHTLPNVVIQAVCDAQYNVIPLQDTNNTITHVAFVTDNAPPKSHATIIDGYATLLKARLADADFYIKRDQKKPLQHYADQLARMTFFASMGNMMDKTTYMAKIIHHMTAMPLDEAEEMTQLAKADLTTQMVAEFPALQGIIGAYYYSEKEKEKHNSEWAEAMRDHYRPFSMEDDLPASELGCVLALADKLDTVVSFFVAGKSPTGSKDPYGLRRAAIGIARILMERLKTYCLRELINCGMSRTFTDGKLMTEGRIKITRPTGEYAEEIYRFIAEQMLRYLEKEYDSHAIVSILKMEQPMTVAEQMERSSALSNLLRKDHDLNFSNVYIRAKHFAKEGASQEYDSNLCQEKTEQAVYVQWQKARSEKEFASRLQGFEALHKPLETFCATVKVLDDDEKIRANRIALMDGIKKDFHELCNMDSFTDLLSASSMWAR